MKTKVIIVGYSETCDCSFMGERGEILGFKEKDWIDLAYVKVYGRGFIPPEIKLVPIKDLEIM